MTASDFCIRSLSSSRLAAPPPKGRPNRGSSSAAAAEVGGGQASLPRTAEGGDEASGGGGVGGEGGGRTRQALNDSAAVEFIFISISYDNAGSVCYCEAPNQNGDLLVMVLHLMAA